ncbi:WD40-repeat-containing domain protein [Lipomyces arxii]|uniref:WD40-repeat-containing domain protein n=1 Tax=Lipomyces arxii TaxID=56418 RepID=UPI0034CEF32D
MDFSELVLGGFTGLKDSQTKVMYPTVSYSGKYIASIMPIETPNAQTVTQYQILIRSSKSLLVKKQIRLPMGFVPRFVKWFEPAAPIFGTDHIAVPLHDNVNRIFAADHAGEIRVWEIDDMIDKSSNLIDLLKAEVVIRQVSWGSNVPVRNVVWGRSPEEILVFSDFQVSIAIWSLVDRRSVEVYHPKFITSKGFSFQPGTRHLTVLTRPVSDDMITVYGGTGDLETLSRFVLPEFYDVKGFKWSPDGKFVAAYDNITNFEVGIYTALGTLYRVFTAPDIGLGVQDIEWSPAGNLLAVASYDGVIRCLNTLTFTPNLILIHSETINIKKPLVFVEQPVRDSSGHAKYQRVDRYPVRPPKVRTNLTDAPPKTGFSVMKFNRDGSLLATKFDLIPTTLWIWSLRSMEPVAILVHVRKIKSVEWHPQHPHLLLTVCAGSRTRDDETYENYDLADVGEENDCCIHVYSSEWRNIYTIKVPKVAGEFASVTDATWLRNEVETEISSDTSADEDSKFAARSRVLVCDHGSYTIGYLDDDQEPEDDDTKVQRLIDGVQQQEWAETTTASCLDDTFAMFDTQRKVISGM